jgi:hypothetical protein
MRLSREGMVLVALGAVDLATTIYVVKSLGAAEGNPIMSYYLSHSVLAFVCAKAALCLVPIFVLEYARRTQPRLVRFAMRTGIAAYVALYCIVLVPQLGDVRLEMWASHVDMHAIESPNPLFTREYSRLERRIANEGPPVQTISPR